MTNKLSKEELLAQLGDLGDEDTPAAPADGPSSTQPPKNTPPSDAEDDPIAELRNLAAVRPTSRPNTPKVPSSSTSGTDRSPRRTGKATPSSTASARTSEEKATAYSLPRKSGESNRSFHQSFTPSKEEVPEKPASPEPQQSGGGWWGSLIGTASAAASAAAKQAEAAMKEIQKNEEAQRWAEQVKGNVGALRSYGDELRSRAIPTFTNILHTIAPPISQHERLQIHITHDLQNYPSLDPLIYATFSRVMAQVEGGDLLVIQRGSESQHRRASDVGFSGGSSSGWNDGPWWRDTSQKREMGVVKGLVEGTKLVRASAEAYSHDFFAARGGVEEAAKQATEVLSETNPVRSSDIFLAIQAVSYAAPGDLFGGAPEGEKKDGAGAVEEPKDSDELVTFAVYLYDPIHSISFRSLSQAFPLKWIEWLDAAAEEDQLPAAIVEIIESGGVDPREWVAEWIEEIVGLAVGVVSQRYVARRMGVGEGGIGRGKARERVEEIGGGEAARAI